MKYKDFVKQTWEKNLPEKLIVNGKNILGKKEVANEFNNFFVKVGPKLAEKTQPSKVFF